MLPAGVTDIGFSDESAVVVDGANPAAVEALESLDVCVDSCVEELGVDDKEFVESLEDGGDSTVADDIAVAVGVDKGVGEGVDSVAGSGVGSGVGSGDGDGVGTNCDPAHELLE